MTDASLSESDGIVTVTLTRPAKLNAITPEMMEVLWDGVRSLAGRDNLRVMIIAAEGRYFTAGIDLATGNARDRAGDSAYPDVAYRRAYRAMTDLYDEFEAVEKPIILAAHSHCLGAGVEMAASCDFRFAARSATFGLPEVRLGVIAGSGGTSRLTRLVGPHWAKYLAMAGQQVDAERAVTMGLLHDVFPDRSFVEDVRAFARDLISIPAEAMGLAKMVIDMSVDTDRTAQRQIDWLANTTLTASDTYRQRVARFTKPAS